MKKLLIPLIASSLVLIGCDKIDDPIQGIEDNGSSNTLKRRIVIEEFTGQLCQACPDGAREIDRLKGVYGDQLIPISIHAGSYAEPGNGAPNDFTTQAGDDYNNTFGVTGWPAGLISRINSGTIYGKFQWEQNIIAIKDDDPIADLTITNTYDTATRNVAIRVDTEWLMDGDAGTNYKLQVYVIEDHITAYQLDGSTPVPSYDHRHMLRGAVNTNWGTVISNTSTGTIDTQNFNYTIDVSWVEANCEVVAFVYKENPDYEVIQANMAHVK
jgi:hypothetical protein